MRKLFRSPRFARTTRRPVGQPLLRPTIEVLEDRLVPATLPGGFSESIIANGIANPTAMEIAPDGRIFVAEQGGRLRVIENGNLLAQPFVTLNVNDFSERGLLGIAFDPNFTTNQFVYVYYTTRSNPIHNRVSRLTANGNVAVPGSESVLLNLPNLNAGNHNGGAIHFGIDGKLYVGIGENAVPSNSQSLSTTLGKILRINSDGTIPNDNPFFNTTTVNNRAIWALGLRNPFTFAVQPGTGRIFINDVGQNNWEEINDGIAGSNYGWPNSEGFRESSDPPTSIGTYRDPLVAYDHNIGPSGGCAIAGGAFYNPAVNQFPPDYTGDYFFADLCSAWIRKYDPQSDQVADFATDLPDAPVDLKVDPVGNLYYLTRGSGSNTGQVTRVQFPTGQNPPAITQHPANQQVAACQPATFSVMATGAAPLGYQWQRDDEDIPGATESTLTLRNLTPGDSGAMFRVVVTNSFGTATSDVATLTVRDGQAPTATISAPPDGTRYNAGDTINFSGSGTDPDDGSLPPGSLTWEVNFHHEDHTHPFIQPFSGVSSDSFVIPTVGETSADVFYRIHLTATDSDGCTHSTFQDVTPNTSMITLETQPPGLQVRLDGQPMPTPISIESVVGMTRQLGFVQPQQIDGTFYRFANWSDFSTARHGIATPAADTTYSAQYVAIGGSLITDLRTLSTSKSAHQIVLTFSSPLDPDTVLEPDNFRITSAGKDGRFSTPSRPSRDDKTLQFRRVYETDFLIGGDPETAAITSTVALDVSRGFHNNKFYRLIIDGSNVIGSTNAVASVNGVLINGDLTRGFPSGDGMPGGDFDVLIGLGRKFRYTDRTGDRIDLQLSGPGQMEITREGPGFDGQRAEAMLLRITGTNASSFLSGRFTAAAPGGETIVYSAIGLVGLRNDLQTNPSFVFGQLAAQVVDRVLDSHENARHRLDYLLDDLLRGRD